MRISQNIFTIIFFLNLNRIASIQAARPPSSHELDHSYTFDQYVSDFEKGYEPGTEEWIFREEIFANNLNDIISHNELFYRDVPIANYQVTYQATYTKGVNQFSDQKVSEIAMGYDKRQHPAYRSNPISSTFRRLQDHTHLPFEIDEISQLPKEVDWREKGVVTPVKNQENCGSCWAFSSVEAIESQIAIATGTLLELSPQQLVSCTPNLQHCGGAGGCAGATSELAFDYVIEVGGMALEDDLTYLADDGVCPLALEEEKDDKHKHPLFLRVQNEESKYTKVAGISDYVILPTNDYKAVMNAVAKMGPVAVAVDARPWFVYESGVFEGIEASGTTDIDHGVVIVGYGTDNETGLDYWIIRNSWGPKWGEKGYIRLRRHSNTEADRVCAMDTTPMDGLACEFDKDGVKIIPEPVEVCGTDGILFDPVVPMGGFLID